MAQNDKQHMTKDGDKFKMTVTRYFDTQEEATNWADSQTVTETPEKPASEMSIEEAEAINSNVVAPPMAAGTETNVGGAGQDQGSDSDQSQTHAPHEMGNPPNETKNKGEIKGETADKA